MLSSSFHPSLIKVTERLTYRQVRLSSQVKQRALCACGGRPHDFRDGPAGGLLRQRRLKRGSLDLDMPEARIILDEAGVPVEIERRRMGRAESLIEEFMILCNEVGLLLLKKRRRLFTGSMPCPVEKLAVLRETLAQWGTRLWPG